MNVRITEPDVRRAQIFELAAKIMTEQGYERTSLADIAAAAGLTKAGVYHHIPSKETLLLGIMNYGMELFETRVLRAIEAIPDPVDRLRACMAGHLRLVTQGRSKEVTVILHESRALRGEAAREINDRKKRYIRFLERTFREIAAAGRLGPVDPTVAAFAFLGMINWTYQWYRPGGRLDESALIASMTEIFFHGALGDRRGNREPSHARPGEPSRRGARGRSRGRR